MGPEITQDTKRLQILREELRRQNNLLTQQNGKFTSQDEVVL